MLDRDDELKLLGFLATLAGLLGVVVSVNQFQVGSVSSATVRAWFSVILVVFMFASALAYLSALQGNDVRQFNMAVLGYFSGLLGMVGGLAAATLYPSEYQFVGFLLTGITLSAVFYWMLQKWHKKLQWNMRSS